MLVVLLFHQLSLNCSIESLFTNENIRVEAEIHNPSDLKKILGINFDYYENFFKKNYFRNEQFDAKHEAIDSNSIQL